jgi:hypothetical protein
MRGGGPTKGETVLRKVHIWAQLGDETFRAYEGEAKRRGVDVETLVEQTVNKLLEELELEEEEGTDHPIIV